MSVSTGVSRGFSGQTSGTDSQRGRASHGGYHGMTVLQLLRHGLDLTLVEEANIAPVAP